MSGLENGAYQMFEGVREWKMKDRKHKAVMSGFVITLFCI